MCVIQKRPQSFGVNAGVWGASAWVIFFLFGTHSRRNKLCLHAVCVHCCAVSLLNTDVSIGPADTPCQPFL